MRMLCRLSGTDLNIDFLYQHGQASGDRISALNRSIFIDGADECLNDGVTPGWMW